MPVQGTWFGLPDFGLTEMLREMAGRQPSAQATTAFNNPAVYQARKQQSFGGQNLAAPGVLGASSGGVIPGGPPNATMRQGGGGGGGAPTNTSLASSTGGGFDEQALAEQRRRSMIDSYKAQAGNLRSEGESTFANILNAVNAFRDRSKTLASNAGQEITNRASGILGANARMGTQAVGDARARGRAFGLGDSSKFNLQNKISGNLAATQGNTIARRGEEERSNQALLQERNDQAQSQEDQGNTYRNSINSRASALENAGYDQAEDQYASSLNDIINYQRQLAAINPVQSSSLQQYAPNFSGIANTVNGVLDGLGGGGTTEESFGNPAGNIDLQNLIAKRNRNPYLA